MHHKLTEQEKVDAHTIEDITLSERVFSILDLMEQRILKLETKNK